MTDNPIACPWCYRAFPVLVTVRELTICPHCLHTCAVGGAVVRKANGTDIQALISDELQALRGTKKQRRQARSEQVH